MKKKLCDSFNVQENVQQNTIFGRVLKNYIETGTGVDGTSSFLDIASTTKCTAAPPNVFPIDNPIICLALLVTAIPMILDNKKNDINLVPIFKFDCIL